MFYERICQWPAEQKVLKKSFRLNKNDPRYLQDLHFKYKDIERLIIKESGKIYHVNIKQKKAGMPILILCKSYI